MNHHHSHGDRSRGDHREEPPRTALAEAFREAEEAAARVTDRDRAKDGPGRPGEAGDATSPDPAAQEQARRQR
ncbi:hypothetical protein [Streptomyces abyssomicinicus]|uniref:hypothetical protein n=1 Tax=Streptomyces abyssomicinicus TaxID=574929 RepID=UPI00125087AB|nr:hypothetical protein [Streptomyces abyssomicinicus]